MISAELKLAGRLDARFFALLDAIAATGSINKAARTAGLSHRGAWLLLDAAGNLAQQPLLNAVKGGQGGGGTQLTEAAIGLLGAWHALQTEHQHFLRAQEARLTQWPALHGLLRRMSMKTSARNQFAGTVAQVVRGPVSAQVGIALSGGTCLTATMTTGALDALELQPEQEVLALIKASSVVLVTDFGGWRLSAHNQLEGTVSRIERGAVSSMVVLTLPGGATLSATLTNEGAEALELKVGAAATAAFKASAVMVAVRA